jgi:hypothetical protein
MPVKPPTQSVAPDFVHRHTELKKKKDEEQRQKEEADRALAVLRSKQLDINRLQEMCQPRKIEKILSPLKVKPVLSDA